MQVESTPMRTKINTWLVLATLLAAAAGGYFFWHSKPLELQTTQLKRGAAIKAVYATGVVEPTVNVPIAPRVAGKLTELLVDEGSRVHKGQAMARLEDANLQHGIEQLAAQELYARQALDRQENIVAQGLGAKADRDKAYAEWKAAKAATDKAREERSFMVLRSPSEGIVMRRDGEVGQYIAINQTVFYVAVEGSLRVSADVDEEDIPLVMKGQRVLIRADAFPAQVQEGQVQEVTPRGDTNTRSYRVRISLAADTPLRVGMTTDTNIIIETHDNVWLLPASAVNNGKVWLARGGKAVQTEVKSGINGDREVEILEGIGPDDVVILTPPASLKDGQRVTPASAASASSSTATK